eukprot:tig00000600_g2272.t1
MACDVEYPKAASSAAAVAGPIPGSSSSAVPMSPIAEVVKLLDMLWLCASGSRDATALNKEMYLRFHRALYRSLRTSWDLAECSKIGEVDFDVDRKGNERGVTREWFRQSLVSLASFWSGASEINSDLVAFLRHVASSLTIEDSAGSSSRRLREWHEVALGACIVPRKPAPPPPAAAAPTANSKKETAAAALAAAAAGGSNADPIALLLADLSSGCRSLRRLAIANCVRRQAEAMGGSMIYAPASAPCLRPATPAAETSSSAGSQGGPRRVATPPPRKAPASFPAPSKRPASFDRDRLPPLRSGSPYPTSSNSKPPSPPPEDPSSGSSGGGSSNGEDDRDRDREEQERDREREAREASVPRRASVDTVPSRPARSRLLRRLGRLPASPAVPLPQFKNGTPGSVHGHAPPLGTLNPIVSASF